MSDIIEERLALLERRVALLESGKATRKESSRAENVFSDLGMVFILEHLSDKIIREPHFDGYDKYLEEMFKCKVTKENRVEIAHKARNMSVSMLEDTLKEFQNSKK